MKAIGRLNHEIEIKNLEINKIREQLFRESQSARELEQDTNRT